MTRPPVLAALIEREGRLLVVRRPYSDAPCGGKWGFPTASEPGEVSLRRLLQDRLGFSAMEFTEPRFTSHRGVRGVAFVPVLVEGRPKLSEYLDIRWMAPLGLAELDLAPSDRECLEAPNGSLNE